MSEVAELYEKHAVELLAYLGKRCPPHAAQDLLHETFLQVMRSEHGDKVTMPRAWLFGIARNILARHYREAPIPLTAIENDSAVDDARVDPRLEQLREAIAELTPKL